MTLTVVYRCIQDSVGKEILSGYLDPGLKSILLCKPSLPRVPSRGSGLWNYNKTSPCPNSFLLTIPNRPTTPATRIHSQTCHHPVLSPRTSTRSSLRHPPRHCPFICPSPPLTPATALFIYPPLHKPRGPRSISSPPLMRSGCLRFRLLGSRG